ncbi:hypothetical protein HCU01_06630 [Halomonas cupida]|uniref:DUF6708 domain-containing protein n=1 Tax=Halomonas cupida TaxID=44933 RepID=A0A1M6ZML3_9GAMM|nr:DUF6708 domain-containing protein [Halomonas cupida]GEN22714.1 hypothetical protein HCU01_06630 [Halomonas cupida]SHL31712.1 hypothetical protein SAMN05660971_00176 [Halomonas cupida]
MYFNDWLLHRTLTASKKDITGFEGDMKAFEKEAMKYGEQYRGFQSRSISDEPSDARSIYRMNDTYMDVRTFFDEWRGGVLVGLSPLLLGVVGFPISFLIPLLDVFIHGVWPNTGEKATAADYIGTIGMWGLWIIMVVAFRYLFKIFRLECLVQRHIVVRFNRKTRKVYINRPNFAGGNKVYHWDDVVASVDPDDMVVTKKRKREILMLFFFKQRTGAEHHDAVFLGAPLRSEHELYALWEYIRRYMEEGPESIPKPRCIPSFPWPWRSLLAPWSFIENRWARNPWSLKMIALVIVLSPVMLLHATAHWCSLLLCWPVYWPGDLRRESKASNPV